MLLALNKIYDKLQRDAGRKRLNEWTIIYGKRAPLIKIIEILVVNGRYMIVKLEFFITIYNHTQIRKFLIFKQKKNERKKKL